MPKPATDPNRHHFRIWVKMAIQSGLIDKLPPVYDADGFQSSVRTDEHARHLLAELRDPDASQRTLKEIIASAQRFKSWVESRRKDSRRRALVDGRPEERIIDMPPGRARAVSEHQRRPRRTQQPDQADTNPALHPLWDKWIDKVDNR